MLLLDEWVTKEGNDAGRCLGVCSIAHTSKSEWYTCLVVKDERIYHILIKNAKPHPSLLSTVINQRFENRKCPFSRPESLQLTER